MATAERISHVRQNRILGTTAGYDAQSYLDRATIAEELGLCPPDLHAPWLADDRRDAPLDRGDGSGNRCAARQGALGGMPFKRSSAKPMPEQIILASSSPFRKSLLANAGIAFRLRVKPEIDERAVEAPLKDSGATPEDVALILATAKATMSPNAIPARWSSARDQTLSAWATSYSTSRRTWKPRAAICCALSGRTHQLNSAVALVRDGETLWSHVGDRAADHATARSGVSSDAISPASATRPWPASAPTRSRAQGIQLFEKIDGDYFTIVGLPLLPLLAALRDRGAIDG